MMKWTPPVSPHGLVGHTEPCEFQSREHERSPSHACYDRRDRFGKRGFRAGFRRPGGAHPGAQATDPEGLFPGNGEPGAADGGDGGLRQRALLGPPLPGTGACGAPVAPRDVRPYVRRNKTDRADAAGMIEAARCAQIAEVPVKSPRQQGLQALHRVREQLKAQRTAAINLVRGLLREYGVTIPNGAAKVRAAVLAALEDGDNEVPMSLRATLAGQLERIAAFQGDMAAIEKRLAEEAGRDVAVQRYLTVPGVGLLTATALRAGAGELSRFKSGRHLAAWIGLVPREHSSGHHRRLGRITKRGDAYLRTLLIHGGRAVLRSALMRRRAGRPLDPLQTWALDLAQRQGHNRAAVALANKLARRLWALDHYA